MSTQISSLQTLVRFGLLSAILVVAGLTGVQRTSANQSGPGVDTIATLQILLCRNFGGQAEVDVTRTGSGFVAVWVVCHGGALDGMDCATGPGPAGPTTDCMFPGRSSRESVREPINTIVKEPAVSDGQGKQPDAVETPSVPEPTTPPQPEPTEEIVIEEPVVDDGGDVVSDPPVDDGAGSKDPIVDDGALVENPVVSDEPTVKDPDPGPSKGDPGIRDPQILPDDIKPIEEPIILT